jgi:F-type H+-transporting ATPase subunit c
LKRNNTTKSEEGGSNMRKVTDVVLMLLLTFVAVPLFAAEGAGSGISMADAVVALAAGFAIGVAAFGGSIAQGRSIVATLEGIARNPGASGKITTPMIIGLAMIESLVIYALLIAFLLQAKF